MNDELLTINFLKSLIKKTSSGKLQWEYLDEEINDDLVIELDLKGPEGPDFDTDNAFAIRMPDQNVSIVVYRGDFPNAIVMHVVPNTKKNILTIHEAIYIALLTELLNTIKRQFPSPYDFMEQFIKD